ncbi:hypothetical protein QRO11_09985 [Paracidovorax citrulli]|uniref:hypothetical protein n=1 Tax=Paracidovorax citrulli TaxID=80869 RepID=UPI00255C8158|nr:hypothetical protein [Paracidovorax citrulli]WIY36622.1 hypothetical protein QRO11_09985 [Paracidovorax citrulli]
MSAGPHLPAGSDQSGDAAAGARPPARGRVRRWLGWILYGLVLAGVGAMLLTAVLTMPPELFIRLQRALRGAAHVGVLVQVAVCVWIVVQWRFIVLIGRRRGIVAKREVRRVMALRWQAALLLALYLVTVPIGPARLLQVVTLFLAVPQS